jgi:hypothetical protein
MAQVHIELRVGKPPRITVDGDHIPSQGIKALGVNFTEDEDPILTIVRLKHPTSIDVDGEMVMFDLSAADIIRGMDAKQVQAEAFDLIEPLDDPDLPALMLEVVARRLEEV